MKTFIRAALKPAVSSVLLTGIYLHLSRLVFGPQLVLEHLLTPVFDAIFALPMTFAMCLLWFSLLQVEFASRWKRVVYIIIAMYFTISVPLHVRTMLAGNVNQFKAFPGWYSLLILPVLAAMLTFVLHLRWRGKTGAGH